MISWQDKGPLASASASFNKLDSDITEGDQQRLENVLNKMDLSMLTGGEREEAVKLINNSSEIMI